jgi:2-keto-3-deoxy-L-rhamnonate aldolase RhmA
MSPPAALIANLRDGILREFVAKSALAFRPITTVGLEVNQLARRSKETFCDQFRSMRPLVGPFVLFDSANLVELLGHTLFDFVVLDYMHSSLSAQTVEDLIRAGDAAQIPSLVRVPPHDSRAIVQSLESGAAGIVVPHVRTKQDVQDACAAAKFPPIGDRGACPSVRAAGFQTRDEADYQRRTNAEIVLIGLIESIDAIQNANDLITFGGLDGYLVGLYDLSTSMGFPGDIHHPAVLQAGERFVEAATTAGCRVGIHLFDPADSGFWSARGVNFFTLSLTSLILRSSQAAINEIVHDDVTVDRNIGTTRQG